MRRFSAFFFFVFCVTAIFSLAFGSAATVAADTPSQFSTVAPRDPLQVELQIVRSVGWSNLGLVAAPAESTPTAMTRYEMALETAKAIIAVRARHNADASWDSTANLRSLRALRALCVAFKSELKSFDVNVPATLNLLDQISTNAQSGASSARRAPQVGSTPNTATNAALPNKKLADKSLPDESLMQSLSQRLRVYSALDSLARQANDPFANAAPSAFSLRQNVVADSGGVQRLRANATFEVNPSLQLRAEFQNENADAIRAPGLRDFLNDSAAASPTDPFGINARSIGAGVNLNVLPGMTFSGGVAHVNEFSRGGGDALRYEGGLGFSGWQNRVALSAHLSRLVPEDSLALGATAARLNLGVGLTSQIQLKLMYQQMFGANAALQSTPRFGGGLDFKF